MIDLIIKNGTVFNGNGAQACDIGIADGKIVTLGDHSCWENARDVIDASGLYVIPGMLDSHAHIASPGAFPSVDDYNSGTIAAAFGGTTTIVDFSFLCPGETPKRALERKLNEARDRSVIDYSFHPCINSADEQSFQEIRSLLRAGFPSIKMFTVYRNSLMLEAAGVYRVLQMIAEEGGIAMVHAENAEMIEYNMRRDIALGHTSVRYHPASRPPISELTAMADVIELSRFTGAPVIFAHVSTGQADSLIARAKAAGQPVFAETCPHYLTLSEEVYAGEDGHKYVCNPPIRSAQDRQLLWSMVQEGKIDVINSDHTDFTLSQKEKNKDFYPDIPGGLPAIETRGMMLFSEGVAKGRITMDQFVRLTSQNIAKLMGLYPQKGALSLGSDADIAILDPKAVWCCSVKNAHMQTDYSPYEGREITGKVAHTIVRGTPIIRDGKYTNQQFRGKLLSRGKVIFPE